MASAAISTTERDIVGTATVGDGPKALVDRAKTLRFVYHDFEERGQYVICPPPSLEAFGELWELHVYPKGIKESNTETEYISVFLKFIGDDTSRPSGPTGFAFR